MAMGAGRERNRRPERVGGRRALAFGAIERVFRQSPAQLEAALAEAAEWESGDPFEAYPDDLSEWEERDEDERMPEDLGPDFERPSDERDWAPAFDPRDAYVLAVRAGGSPVCAFGRPAWMMEEAPEVGRYLEGLAGMLDAAAAWLTRHRAGFLRDAAPAAWLRGETDDDFRCAPIVTADGFYARVLRDLAVSGLIGSEHFSRVHRYVWLCWPDRFVPLAALFSREMKLLWAAEGCRRLASEPARWAGVQSPAVARQRAAQAEPGSFARHTLEQRLGYLLRRSGLLAAQDAGDVLAILRGAIP